MAEIGVEAVEIEIGDGRSEESQRLAQRQPADHREAEWGKDACSFRGRSPCDMENCACAAGLARSCAVAGPTRHPGSIGADWS
jgi:hypothetical protein